MLTRSMDDSEELEVNEWIGMRDNMRLSSALPAVLLVPHHLSLDIDVCLCASYRLEGRLVWSRAMRMHVVLVGLISPVMPDWFRY